MGAFGVALRLVAVGHLLGQVPDAAGGVLGAGQHALGVEPVPEPGHAHRLILGGDRVESVVPGGQDFPGARINIRTPVLIPHRPRLPVELHGRGVRPPHLVVGRGQNPVQLGAGDGAAHRDVDVRGQPPLWLDGGEVLHVVAEETAQVLDEPV